MEWSMYCLASMQYMTFKNLSKVGESCQKSISDPVRSCFSFCVKIQGEEYNWPNLDGALICEKKEFIFQPHCNSPHWLIYMNNCNMHISFSAKITIAAAVGAITAAAAATAIVATALNYNQTNKNTITFHTAHIVLHIWLVLKFRFSIEWILKSEFAVCVAFCLSLKIAFFFRQSSSCN